FNFTITDWIRANGCTWSNGDPVTFISLTRNFTEERCCGALTTGGTWECFNCSSKMYFMCYKQGDHILIPENKTWLEAQLYCKKNQSNLVSIRNEMENEQVKEAVNGSDSVWIGLQYNYKVACPFIANILLIAFVFCGSISKLRHAAS
uniref:C-type lectin domain-containing protein n=1 Tax=Sinocyclocheilus anshuiensis TaxID=1608454 RepID=A0A671T468_9TELE